MTDLTPHIPEILQLHDEGLSMVRIADKIAFKHKMKSFSSNRIRNILYQNGRNIKPSRKPNKNQHFSLKRRTI